ncbi:MAG TPA: 2-C-methyl-D-erythritol 2,4-cyclodiphosphate synthase [Candidatus Omnitrophota bacterium]|nr:2-C-methyl-D-erythritol 2,4-cyclodiphosphate synthase [Candidatus Omnitrophota bacterium]HPD84779.1 2-C-methyl-D-erythritol 2,4-cyclodiphosphate synthase [Candidatus Omnitrophota bacterium]HRZ03637.1 2-C-methyl-D-erythritol 2,4-cyclodiphosphate synthase [Candidatus Omnitrophota bacterium]
MAHKVGIGYDIHRLVKGRKLVLGGVPIPYIKGLLGHSDGDVIVHAICDALLGALGKGDIGEHFPNTDKRFKDISSLILLSTVGRMVKKQGFKIANIDTMVLAERPKLQFFKPAMCRVLANTLKIPVGSVNIKATTQEGLGFGGVKEAIAAYAVVLIKK